MKERLREMIREAEKICDQRKQCEGCIGLSDGCECVDRLITEYLIENGVIVPPCKIGDKVYVLSQKSIQEYTVHAIEINENSTTIKCYSWLAERESLLHKHIAYFGETDFGKTVFTAKEEAEKALAERGDGGERYANGN